MQQRTRSDEILKSIKSASIQKQQRLIAKKQKKKGLTGIGNETKFQEAESNNRRKLNNTTENHVETSKHILQTEEQVENQKKKNSLQRKIN